MKIKVLWMDGIEQAWKVSYNKHKTIEYYIRDGCVDFTGKMILPHKVKPLDERDVIMPLSHIRWIEIEK